MIDARLDARLLVINNIYRVLFWLNYPDAVKHTSRHFDRFDVLHADGH
tara:strand:- start:542 stop:685 length:144 start_codon:yes stop_codon:yes gene_type:complete